MLMTTHLSVICYVYVSVKNKLVHIVNSVTSWFESKNMTINPNKLQCVVSGRNENRCCFGIREYTKIFWLHLDGSLNIDTHTPKLRHKVEIR